MRGAIFRRADNERMNRTIKEATVQRYHYDRNDQVEAHLADFIQRLQLRSAVEDPEGPKCWTSQPERFKLNPLQKMPGLNT